MTGRALDSGTGRDESPSRRPLPSSAPALRPEGAVAPALPVEPALPAEPAPELPGPDGVVLAPPVPEDLAPAEPADVVAPGPVGVGPGDRASAPSLASALRARSFWVLSRDGSARIFCSVGTAAGSPRLPRPSI